MTDKNDPALADVRKAIEQGTAKVSLRDLERKGYRQVKVLKAGDIDKLVHQAVLSVLSKKGVLDSSERDKFEGEAKAEYKRRMKERNAFETAKTELEQKVTEQRQKLLALETQRQETELSVHEFEQRIASEKVRLESERNNLQSSFLAEKEKIEREKQSLYERGLESQQTLVQNYERQLAELRSRLGKADDGADFVAAEARYKAQITAFQERLRSVETEKQRLEQEEIPSLRLKLLETNKQAESRMEQMFSQLTSMVQQRQEEAPAAGGELKTAMTEMFEQLNDKLSRRMVSATGEVTNADEAAAAAVTGMMLNEVNDNMETNIQNVDVKQTTTTEGVKDVMAKLKSLRGGK